MPIIDQILTHIQKEIKKTHPNTRIHQNQLIIPKHHLQTNHHTKTTEIIVLIENNQLKINKETTHINHHDINQPPITTIKTLLYSQDLNHPNSIAQTIKITRKL